MHLDPIESKFNDNLSKEIGNLQLQSNTMSDEDLLASPTINVEEYDGSGVKNIKGEDELDEVSLLRSPPEQKEETIACFQE